MLAFEQRSDSDIVGAEVINRPRALRVLEQ